LEKIKDFDFKIIAPSHGYLYDKPEFILNLYNEWVSESVKNSLIILYVSMHGSTKNIVDFLTKRFVEEGINIKRFNLTNSDIGEIAMSLVDSASLVLATPTVLTGPHPLALYATYVTNILKPKTKFIGIVGSYGWGGQMPNIIKETLKNIKAEYLGEVLIKGDPREDDYRTLDDFVNKFVNKHKELNLL
jgi:flavorubredoxin